MYFRKKCKITFLCHGATIYSEEGRFSDLENYPPLSDLGVTEMENLLDYLRERGVKNDVIYSSPSVRTRQSALMVAKAFKTDYITVFKLFYSPFYWYWVYYIYKLLNLNNGFSYTII